MTPGAQVSAVIDILDNYLVGVPENKALLNWFRGNRFAGSNDRRAIRDIFFNCLRFKRSSLWPFETSGYRENGRYLVMGMLTLSGERLSEIFNEEKYSPKVLTENEKVVIKSFEKIGAQAPLSVKHNFPEFLEQSLKDSFNTNFFESLKCLNTRASLFLRVNCIKGTRKSVISSLKKEGIVTEFASNSNFGLKVLKNAKYLDRSQSYLTGEVEIQDISSQAAVDFIKPMKGKKILDFCAGGGGKTLAMASLTLADGEFFVHDISVSRTPNLIKRCKRAGFSVRVLTTDVLENLNDKFDLVVADVPCSGTGAWRRNPGSKWWLTRNKLDNLLVTQKDILETASKYVKTGGILAYMTCSVLKKENKDQIDLFLSVNKDFCLEQDILISPLQGGDGFYASRLRKVSN